ncbi:phosphotransferase family protein [Kitasatospora sp. NPDC058965]|uniref:phosphotransferase family protein n=1 Tax=Kitasatospora sp. NPDC058965 TaxID=3346682 RepID=UPI00367F8C4C
MTSNPADLALGMPEAELLVRAVHPTARVTGLDLRTGGRLSTVYEVRCADPAHSVIVKSYQEQWRWKQRKEVHVYRLLAAVPGWPAPAVLHATPAGPGGRAATVLSLLPGRELSAAGGPDGAGIASIYRQLGSSLAALHRTVLPAFGYLTTEILDPAPDNASYMARQFDRKLAEFAELGGAPELHRAIRARIAGQETLFATCRAPVLCHNDLHEGNMLVAPVAEGPGVGVGAGAGAGEVQGAGRSWRLTGLVDVENAIAADPLMDLAKLEQYAVRGDAAKRAALLSGYGPLPADAEARLALYQLYFSLELWAWFASVGELDPLPGLADDLARLADPGAGH